MTDELLRCPVCNSVAHEGTYTCKCLSDYIPSKRVDVEGLIAEIMSKSWEDVNYRVNETEEVISTIQKYLEG